MKSAVPKQTFNKLKKFWCLKFMFWLILVKDDIKNIIEYIYSTNYYVFVLCIVLISVFRIRIWIRIRSDPYHWPGSGSGNVELDPGTKKKS